MTDYISNIDIGKEIYIPDGTTWAAATQNADLDSHSWYALAYNGTKFVALSETGYISTSTDGTTWATATQNANLNPRSWRALAYDGTKFVALSVMGYISTSTDGTTWTAATLNANLGNNDWHALAYDGSKFVALGVTGYISTSTDGTTWTTAVQNTNLGSHSWYALAYDGSKFVALGYGGYISTSTDGTTWTAATLNANLGSNFWYALTYDGTKFVALGGTGYISTSTDGTNWAQATQNTDLGNNHTWLALAYDSTKFVALSYYGYTSTSPSTSTSKIPIGGDNFDGQWDSHSMTILSNGTLSGETFKSYSLSSYLPDDNYDYEVYFSGSTNSTASSGKTCQLTIFSGTVTSNNGCGYRLNRCTARTSSTVRAGGCAIIPIYSNDRNVTIYTQDSSTNNQGTYFYAKGFRRIGKNDTSSNYISNINSYLIGGNNFNGNTTMFTSDQSGLVTGDTEHNLLFTNTTISGNGVTSFSVSNVIPNDGYDYELCLSIWSKPPQTSGKVLNLNIASGSSTDHPFQLVVGIRIARTGASYNDFKTIWLPISANDKYITMLNLSSDTATLNCQIHGYRRIGTND